LWRYHGLSPWGSIKDTHDFIQKEIATFLTAYEELGRKISRFIDFVEKEWNARKDSSMNP
jgi:hypothetical protein